METTEMAVEHLIIHPGTGLLFRVPEAHSPKVFEEWADRIQEVVADFSDALGWKVPVLVIGENVEVGVVSLPPEGEQGQ
jgi:hypothetical protein